MAKRTECLPVSRQEYGNHLAVDDSDGAGGNPIETSDKGLI